LSSNPAWSEATSSGFDMAQEYSPSRLGLTKGASFAGLAVES